MSTFNNLVGRLQEEYAVATLTELRKAMGVNKTTFSSWKRRNTIPLGAIVRCWLKYNMDFDLKYVLSGERFPQPSYLHPDSGAENMSWDLREVIEIIGQDQTFARAFVRFYEAIASRYRDTREPGPVFPIKEPGPEVGIAEISRDTPPKGK